MKPHQKKAGDKFTTTVANLPGKPDMHKQSKNVQSNHIIIDDEFESAKKSEIRSLNISTTFVTDNRKTKF